VSHTEITERKRAEIEAQRSRENLAHFTRTSTMGELTASLAHELNQPLTGIITNAQSAQRLVQTTQSGGSGERELHDTLAEIAEDARRASEVVQRIRSLVRKGERTVVSMNINTVVADVIQLLSSDAILRNVNLKLNLHAEPLTVRGDPVQLRQVVMNLVINALEAVSESPEAGRTVIVRTARTEEDAVHVSVVDAGPGLHEGTETRVFEPFYTTKPAGMGMGLSIAKSIVEAHGGLIWARNNRDRGVTFQFTLPLALSE
jgi:C4-dicarboxylate-specific signal transduction histidine kinase